jgi:hypothetical protein
MALILVLLAFIFGVALVMGFYFGVLKIPGLMLQRKVEGRLQELSQPVDAGGDKEKGKLLVKVQHEGPLPALDRFIGNTTKGSALGRWIEQSGSKASVSGILLIALLLAGVGAFAVGMLTRAAWAIPIGACIGLAIPFVVLKVKRTKRLRHEDGGRRDAGAGRPRIPQDVRRAELRPADEGRARQPDAAHAAARRAVLRHRCSHPA